jgi:hypothetical protein
MQGAVIEFSQSCYPNVGVLERLSVRQRSFRASHVDHFNLVVHPGEHHPPVINFS